MLMNSKIRAINGLQHKHSGVLVPALKWRFLHIVTPRPSEPKQQAVNIAAVGQSSKGEVEVRMMREMM